MAPVSDSVKVTSGRDPRLAPTRRPAPRRADRARRSQPGAAPGRAAGADRPQRRRQDDDPAAAGGTRGDTRRRRDLPRPDGHLRPARPGRPFDGDDATSASPRSPTAPSATSTRWSASSRGSRRWLDDPEVYARWDELHERFERRGGYARRARRDAVLHALGFAGREDDLVAAALGRRADPPRPRPAADGPTRRPAARRAHQPPRPRDAGLARGLRRPLPGRRGPGVARPRLPRRRLRPHRRGRPRRAAGRPRQPQRVPDARAEQARIEARTRVNEAGSASAWPRPPPA
jgi:hypothetical protein